MAGAEAYSASGGPNGVLVLHGFTGNPSSMRPLAVRLADAGLAVELPRLPGHGTSVDDMVSTTWADWSGAAEAAYLDLAGRCDAVAVVGLSMGATLACWLAERHVEVTGVAVINPLVTAPEASLVSLINEMLATGTTVAPGIGSDIAKPDNQELAYPETPLAAVLSLYEAAGAVGANLGAVRCPVLLFSSRQDHVVSATNGDLVVAESGGRVERVWLERSAHVATLDWDAPQLEAATVNFVSGVTVAEPA